MDKFNTAAAASHLNELRLALLKVDSAKIADLANILSICYGNGGRIYTCGNGGSSSIASHFVVDLNKGLYCDAALEYEASCLTDSIPSLTAWCNDDPHGYAISLSAQLKRAQPEDCLVCFSGTGNSENVLNAAHQAHVVGMESIAICAFGGGKLSSAVKHCLVVDTYDMQVAEDIFSCICHAIFKTIKAEATRPVTLETKAIAAGAVSAAHALRG